MATTRWTCSPAKAHPNGKRCSTSAGRPWVPSGLVTSSSSSTSSLGAGPERRPRRDMPTMVNIRQDPFERTPSIRGESLNNLGGGYMNDFFAREFWRFVMVQQYVAKLAETAINYPPMQDPASFNLDAVKKKVEELIKNRPGQ